MGAGGSHPQATMVPDPWATYKCPSANEGQATTSARPETSGRVPTNKGTFALTDPWARSCRPSEGQTTGKAPPETVTRFEQKTLCSYKRVPWRSDSVNYKGSIEHAIP